MSGPLDPRIPAVLDGELPPGALPPALRGEAEAGLRVLAAADRTPVTLRADLAARVMARVRHRPAARRFLVWFRSPQEVRLHIRPWVASATLAAAAALVVLVARPRSTGTPVDAPVAARAVDSIAVRFVLYAPEARAVAVAGTFNQWDASAAPLVRSDPAGVWTATLVLPAGEHQYAFVVDGRRFVADPAAPAVDDGFGRKNSLLALPAPGSSL
jgi:hypothetical protein